MALRSLAGKLRAFLPRRATPPRPPTAMDLGKENPVDRNIAKSMAEDTWIIREIEERNRRLNRFTMMFVAAGVVISAFCVRGIIKNFEEMREGRIQAVHKAIHKARKANHSPEGGNV